MKLIHWAIIFTIIILPFSLICRNNINNRFAALKDEVRINNSVDTATQDAVDFLAEWATVMGGANGKHIELEEGVIKSAIEQFFTTMAVNMNMPYATSDSAVTQNAKSVIEGYIPAMVIVGYDGFYIYSGELVGGEVKYILKPKIPYTYEENNMVINFTLDNYVTIYNKNGLPGGMTTRVYQGYLYDEGTYDDPDNLLATASLESITQLTTNLSLIIDKLCQNTVFNDPNTGFPDFLVADNVSSDYQFDEKGNMIAYPDGSFASDFHIQRRETIVNLITQALNEEVNEHNHFASMLGVQYDFSLPQISKSEWINTVDDVSVLAFIQGVPIGIDQYYNNYALGGTRIVRGMDIYGGVDGKYHKPSCTYLALDEATLDSPQVQEIGIPSKEDAAKKGYYWCEVCKP